MKNMEGEILATSSDKFLDRVLNYNTSTPPVILSCVTENRDPRI